MHHFDGTNILTDAQHCFRKRRSCDTQLILAVQDLANSLDDRTQSDVILLDFSKAFDKVPHARLLYKLTHYGISGTTQNWINDFLKNRTQRFVLEGSSSDVTVVTSGVPQGSILGPTYSPHRHSRARPLCAYFHTFSMLRTRLLVFEFHAFSNVCNQTGRSTYMILPVWYYSSD